MQAHLQIARSAQKVVAAKMRQHGIPLNELLAWKANLEAELGDDPGKRLKYIPGGDPFHECKTKEPFRDKQFVLVWELEWIRATNALHLLDLHIIELNPQIAKPAPTTPPPLPPPAENP